MINFRIKFDLITPKCDYIIHNYWMVSFIILEKIIVIFLYKNIYIINIDIFTLKLNKLLIYSFKSLITSFPVKA